MRTWNIEILHIKKITMSCKKKIENSKCFDSKCHSDTQIENSKN